MEILIVGGGIGGLCAARTAALAGHCATVLERADSTAGVGAGLLLWPNAVRALDALGCGHVRDIAAVARRMVVSGARGQVLSVVDVGKLGVRAGVPMLVVERPDLLGLLADGVHVRFGASVSAVGDGGVTLADGSRLSADLVLGADGIGSVARQFVCPGAEPIDTDFTVVRGIADADVGEGQASEAWGAGELVGGVGLRRGRSYWFYEGREVDAADPLAAVRRAAWPASVAALVDATPPDAVLVHRIRRLDPVPVWTRGAVGLLGDAVHAMEPNLGQGAAQAIEDAEALLTALQTGAGGPAEILAAYADERRGRAAFFQRESTRFARMALSTRTGPRDVATRLVPEPLRARMLERLMRRHAPARLLPR